jgi:hypothetical protein
MTSIHGWKEKSTKYMFIHSPNVYVLSLTTSLQHSDDILGARMLWKPKEARILKNFIDQPV